MSVRSAAANAAGAAALRARGRFDRLAIVHGVLALFAVALVGKAGKELLWRGDYWSRVAERLVPDMLQAVLARMQSESGE